MDFFGHDYETVAASQTAQQLGPTGAKGDILERLIVVPATTAAGNISINDGGGSEISLFATGTLSNLQTFVIELGIRSTTGSWRVTTGANVSVIAVGKFS